MRILLSLIVSFGFISALSFAEEDERSVYLRPSEDAPVIGTLPKGAFVMSPTQPAELSDRQRAEGWEAISYLDHLQGFVQRTDLTKDLFVQTGARIYSHERSDPRYLLTLAEAEDHYEIENLTANWVEVSFRKPITAFIRSDDSNSPSPVGIGTASQSDGDLFDSPAEQKESVAKQEPSRAPVATKSAISDDSILRTFEGWLGTPRSFFGRKPLYPYQIVDASGNRIAYLDLSRLLITTPLEHFIGRKFLFYGRAEPIEGKRDFVIRVEQMRQN
ncbi:MAG TPA: hypothetical protein VK041_10155 [Opitutales bacterium]|nr:hypothetical protein [Opitutales bacterium]